jgi:hypothetical protein
LGGPCLVSLKKLNWTICKQVIITKIIFVIKRKGINILDEILDFNIKSDNKTPGIDHSLWNQKKK